ncbi:MAG: MotA/TolQ/ExbB proton channel family protein, partial [Marinobacter sp.]|nr:MotA/TolQ/ExbB proton channel family protein [Marinobacter sp.]
GIYEALTTTAAGLVIAIPFAAIAAWIEFRLRRIHQTVNYTLITVLSVADSEEAFVSEPPSSVSPQTNSVQEDPGTANETARYDRQGLAHATG